MFGSQKKKRNHVVFASESKAENTPQAHSCSQVTYCTGSVQQGETKKIQRGKAELFLKPKQEYRTPPLLKSRTQRTLQLVLQALGEGFCDACFLLLLSGLFKLSFLGQDLHIAAVAQIMCDCYACL